MRGVARWCRLLSGTTSRADPYARPRLLSCRAVARSSRDVDEQGVFERARVETDECVAAGGADGRDPHSVRLSDDRVGDTRGMCAGCDRCLFDEPASCRLTATPFADDTSVPSAGHRAGRATARP
jgi:hypothetical protein